MQYWGYKGYWIAPRNKLGLWFQYNYLCSPNVHSCIVVLLWSIIGVTQACMHILNDDLHFPHLPTTCCSRRSNFHLEPWVKTSSWSPADLLLVSPHRGVRKARASTAWQICYDNDLIFQRCSLNRAYMARENANIVQRKPSLCLLNDPEWLHCNGPIWSVQQGLEEARETVRAESEWWRPSSWECFQSRLCRHKTKHVSSTGAHHTYIPSPAFTPSIWVFFSVLAFRRSSASQGVWAWPFSSAKNWVAACHSGATHPFQLSSWWQFRLFTGLVLAGPEPGSCLLHNK